MTILIVTVQLTESAPQLQFFGQTFSQSSFSGPNGQVVSSSIYTDSDGNKVINGVNYPTNNVPVASVQSSPQPQQQSTVQRPQVQQSSKPIKDNSGAYKPDDRGKYKGN